MFTSPRLHRRSGTLLPVVLVLVGTACSGAAPMTTPSPVSTPTDASTPSPTLPPDPNLLMTVAGGGTELGDGGPATSAGLCGPNDVTVDAAGNLYISDGGIYCSGPGGHTVRKVDPDGIITTFAGTGTAGFSGDGGPATAAQLNVPMSVAVDGEGNVYIADLYDYRIRKVDPSGIITTFAGTGERGSSGDGGPATEAQLFECCPPDTGFPGGLAVDADGNLFVADGRAVRRIDTSGNISTVAATEVVSGPYDVAIDGDGNLYISDIDGRQIHRLDPDGVMTTLAGGPDNVSTADGIPATSAFLHDPWGIAGDSGGNLFVAEHHANTIRRIGPDGTITTVAGIRRPSSGGRGLFNGEEGPATHVHLNEPIGLFVDAAGVLYIADAFNARIRAVRFADGS